VGNGFSQNTSDLEGMVEVKTCIDSGPENFVDQVAGVLESVLMHGIRERQAVDDRVHSGGAEKAGDA
jgi:hypothetical protein